MTNAAQVVNDYLAAFTRGDFDTARRFVADDFVFRGPFIQTTRKDDYFAGARGLLPIVGGHRVLRQWTDGDEVCTVYELMLHGPAGDGAVAMAEWHCVREGQLISSRLIFDTAEFRARVPAR